MSNLEDSPPCEGGLRIRDNGSGKDMTGGSFNLVTQLLLSGVLRRRGM